MKKSQNFTKKTLAKVVSQKLEKQKPKPKKKNQVRKSISDYYFQFQQESVEELSQSALVSQSETYRFKIEYLLESYSQLVSQIKSSKIQFQELMKMQLERHTYYYNQIAKYVQNTRNQTKKILNQRIEDINNTFILKIACLQMKLAKINRWIIKSYQISGKSNVRKKNDRQQKIEKKATINFEQQLKEFYQQKKFQINLNFVENEQIQQSIDNFKNCLITDWHSNSNSSISFSNVTACNETFSEYQFDRNIKNSLFQDKENNNTSHINKNSRSTDGMSRFQFWSLASQHAIQQRPEQQEKSDIVVN